MWRVQHFSFLPIFNKNPSSRNPMWPPVIEIENNIPFIVTSCYQQQPLYCLCRECRTSLNSIDLNGLHFVWYLTTVEHFCIPFSIIKNNLLSYRYYVDKHWPRHPIQKSKTRCEYIENCLSVLFVLFIYSSLLNNAK